MKFQGHSKKCQEKSRDRHSFSFINISQAIKNDKPFLTKSNSLKNKESENLSRDKTCMSLIEKNWKMNKSMQKEKLRY